VGWIDDFLFDEDLVLVVEDETFIGSELPLSYVVRGKSWVNNHARALRPLGGMSADYLNICLSYYDFVPLTSGTTGRRKVTKGVLVTAPLDVAPPTEQTEIVRRVDALFALADSIEQRVADAFARANALTQATLAKAFRGELVGRDMLGHQGK
jgi:type I restriction enzyme, S subunit